MSDQETTLERLRYEPEKTVLLVVDMQPDFMPGGALAVAEGDALKAPIGALMESSGLQSDRFGLCVATQDWHPPGHASFASSHEGYEPREVIRLHGHDQILWPDHCVQGSEGAALAPGMPWDRANAILRKGTDPLSDSYSGFRNNWNAQGERPSTGLTGYLRDRGVETVVICGLTRDFCAFWSAEDAADAGFSVHFLWDLTRPVDPANDASVRETLLGKGVVIVRGGA